VNLPQSIANGFSNYLGFHGRASRAEFWYWLLFAGIMNFGAADLAARFDTVQTFSTISGLITLALLLPTIAVAVRRLHDSGKAGSYLLLGLIPVVGPFLLLAAMLQPSMSGANIYGENPVGDYGADYYQSQQYLPPSMSRAQLPQPLQFGYGFPGVDLRAEPDLEPVPVRTATDDWSRQFNQLKAQARLDVPDEYKKHYFTETELRELRAGRPQVVLLEDAGVQDFYLASVTWNGANFDEERLDLPTGF